MAFPEGTSQKFFYLERLYNEDAYQIRLLRYTYGPVRTDARGNVRQTVAKSEALTENGWVEYHEGGRLPDDLPKIPGHDLRLSRDEEKWVARIQEATAKALGVTDGGQ